VNHLPCRLHSEHEISCFAGLSLGELYGHGGASCCPFAAPKSRLRAYQDNRNVQLQALRETGATGLEPATSGVTGVRKPFQRVSSSRRNRVTVRLFRVATLPGLPQFFVWFHRVVSMTFPG
jgi:hypothetical protein